MRVGSKAWQIGDGRDKDPSPTCTPGTITKRITKTFLQMISFLDKRKEVSQCREEAFELTARLEESLESFSFPIQENKEKEKTVFI